MSEKLSSERLPWSNYRGRTVLALSVLLLVTVACSRQEPRADAQPAAPPKVLSASSAAPMPDAATADAPHFNGQRAMQYVREVVALGPRPVGSPAHQKLENYLRSHLRGDNLEEDSFTASTPNGPIAMRNFIAKFPGARDGIIVVAGHYDTKPLKNFVGANDAGSSTGLPLELANQLRGPKRAGCSVWLVFLDGEESVQESNQMDFSNSMYGSQHLAQKWQNDGTAKKIKAFLLVDMVGDADLNIERDEDSTPWLEDLILSSAKRLGYQSHFFRRTMAVEDDHVPFRKIGIPVADLIDFDYGYNNVFWHTPEDTVDKLSANSLEIVGNVVLETIGLLDQR